MQSSAFVMIDAALEISRREAAVLKRTLLTGAATAPVKPVSCQSAVSLLFSSGIPSFIHHSLEKHLFDKTGSDRFNKTGSDRGFDQSFRGHFIDFAADLGNIFPVVGNTDDGPRELLQDLPYLRP